MTSNAKICDEINISAQRGYTDEGQCQDGLSLFIWLAEVSVERLPGLCRSGCEIEAAGLPGSAAGGCRAGWALPIGIGHWATGMAWPTGRCPNVPVRFGQ